MLQQFPRTNILPKQSTTFWVTHKDRYLRQLLIRDIEEETGRPLIVYFTDCDRTNAMIDPSDDIALAELLSTYNNESVDLLLETNGGMTDATEKICGLLQKSTKDLRVIVPRKAKSNGTVIALCGSAILMGNQSELGPIDPSIRGVPAHFIVSAQNAFHALDVLSADSARKQTIKLASSLLKDGMMKSFAQSDIDNTVNKLATKVHYHSHGSSIDADEAKRLKLNVIHFSPDDVLWQKIWLLRAMYHYDCEVYGYCKIFENKSISSAIAVNKPPAPPVQPSPQPHP